MHLAKGLSGPQNFDAIQEGVEQGLVDLSRQRRGLAPDEGAGAIGGIAVDQGAYIRLDEIASAKDRGGILKVRADGDVIPGPRQPKAALACRSPGAR